MKTQPIKSDPGPTSRKPWYDLTVENGAPKIVADKDGGTEFDMSGATHRVPDFVDLPSQARPSMSKNVVYAVTTDGQFIAYEQGKDLSEHGVSLRAHLGWYDADADELTVLEFVE